MLKIFVYLNLCMMASLHRLTRSRRTLFPPVEGEVDINFLFLVRIPFALAWCYVVCKFMNKWANWSQICMDITLGHDEA